MSLRDLMLSAMDAPENRLDETFTVLAFCGACGHQAPLDRTRVPAGVSLPEVCQRLRCSACGSRETDLRILYAGAGGSGTVRRRPMVRPGRSGRSG